jgi:N,N'-diacetyllegionaminate synthase
VGVELIAEVSSNHGGDLSLAKEFIQRFAEAGADWIKFQSYQVKTLRPDDPQRDWLAQAELSDDAHYELKAECERVGVKFLTTVFHHSRVPFLKSLGSEAIKIGSGEAVDEELATTVLHAEFRRVFVSYGLRDMSGEYEGMWPGTRITRFWTTSLYPTPPERCELLHIGEFWQGYSDHTVGVEVPKAAIAKGADVVEVHVTIPGARQMAWDKTVEQFRDLRAYAEFIDTITRPSVSDFALSAFLGRWQHA